MKKALALLLALLMIFACCSLTACDDNKKKNKTNSSYTDIFDDDSEKDTETEDPNSTTAKCQSCFTVVKTENTISTSDDYTLCMDCFYNFTAYCDFCEKLVAIHHDCAGFTLCETCYKEYTKTTCHQCEDEIDSPYTTHDEFDLCKQCYEKYVRICDICDNSVYLYSERNGKNICRECY